MTTMPAITIRQPWANAILHLGKNVENRSWRTKHRGPILIHAGLSCKKNDVADCALVVNGLGMRRPGWLTTGAARGATGGIVGVVTIVDCVQNHPSPWAIPGQWHWVLAAARPLPFQACKGRLGIWQAEYPHEIQEAAL